MRLLFVFPPRGGVKGGDRDLINFVVSIIKIPPAPLDL